MLQVLACGAAIVTLSMGIRHGFGLWLQPITQDMGWSRQSFALALAVQNLSWGVMGIFAGMVADRFGALRVLVGGAVLYALGLAGMALAPTTVLFAPTAGVLIGTAVGVLPGIGPAMTVALLLPLTYTLEPAAALITFAGIYYGGMYGGSTTSILLNTPGESASVMTALEGNKMAKKGRAAQALAPAGRTCRRGRLQCGVRVC